MDVATGEIQQSIDIKRSAAAGGLADKGADILLYLFISSSTSCCSLLHSIIPLTDGPPLRVHNALSRNAHLRSEF